MRISHPLRSALVAGFPAAAAPVTIACGLALTATGLVGILRHAGWVAAPQAA